METGVLREITPLGEHDFMYVADRHKKEFDYPIHCHEVMELNFGESWEISGVPGHESVAVERGLVDDVARPTSATSTSCRQAACTPLVPATSSPRFRRPATWTSSLPRDRARVVH